MSLFLSASKGLAGKCVACTLVRTSLRALCRGLNGAVALVFILEDVGVLVGCPSRLCRKRLISSKEIVPLVGKALTFLSVRLIVESVAIHIVIAARLLGIIHHIVVWMAQHIGAVLSLLQGSGFGHISD